MTKALTVKGLENIRPGPARREIPDGHMPGLYFVVQPTGATSWAVRYRHGGMPRKLTLGAYPALKLADARESAGEALRAVAEGRDPASEKLERRRRAREGVAESDLVPVVLELFLTRHVRPKNRSAADVERLLKVEVARPWATRSIQEIGRRDVIELVDAIMDRGAPYTANRVFTNFRKMLNWCQERGIISTVPMVGLKPPAVETTRDRILSDEELRRFWAGTKDLGFPFGPLFRLLLLTGQRRDEVGNMARSELDLATSTWTIPKERVKNNLAHEVALSPLALETIRDIPNLPSTRVLMFSTTGTTAVSGYSNAKERLDASMLAIARREAAARGEEDEGVSIPNWRLHDLRRTAASGMARLGQPVHVVEAVLNHKSGTIRGVAAVYNRYSYSGERRRALEAWASFVEQLVTGEPASNVVALRAAP
jgi:integrase